MVTINTENYFDIESLITVMQCRSILWQDKHKDYRIMSMTEKIWKEENKGDMILSPVCMFICNSMLLLQMPILSLSV